MENVNIILNDPISALYERAKKVCNDLGITAALTLQTLRIMQALDPATKKYIFSVYQVNDQNKVAPIENKLDINDGFFAFGLGLKVIKNLVADSDFNHHDHLAYADPTVFSAAGEATAVKKVWRGALSYINGNDVEIREMSTNLLEYAPERLMASKTGPQQFGPSLPEKGYSFLAPPKILIGGESDTFELTLGNGVLTGIDGPAADKNFVSLELVGFRAVNASARLKGFYGKGGNCTF